MSFYSVNSTNNNIGYAFFMPIVCLLWKKMGYIPIVLLLGNENEWNSNINTKYILENIRLQSDKIFFINHVHGLTDSTATQISRLYTTALNIFANDDYVITSDVDMLPLNKDWFCQQDCSKAFNIWGADAYLNNGKPHRFPICYLGAKVIDWRKLIGITDLDLNYNLNMLNKSRDNWDYDETLFFERISRSSIYPHNCQLISRGWPDGRAARRMDRVAWDWQNQTNLIDAHCPRPGHLSWGSIGVVLQKYCNESEFNFINNYRKFFDKS